MRIGFFTDDYTPRVDGVVVSIDLMRRALEELGHEVFVACPRYPGYEETDERVIRLWGVDPFPFSDFASRTSVVTPAALKRLKALNLDIIHSHTQGMGAGALALKIAKDTGAPHVSTYHTMFNELVDHYPYSTFAGVVAINSLLAIQLRSAKSIKTVARNILPIRTATRRQINAALKAYFSNVDTVIANSERVYEYLGEVGIDTPVAMVRNGIDIASYGKTNPKRLSKTPVIVSASRISSEKRQDVLIGAVAGLKRRGINATLRLIGDGAYRNFCENYAKRLGVQDRVEFLGEMKQKDVAKELAKCDIGAIASYHFDTYPLVVMEYLASGMPVVYCDEKFDHMVSKNCSRRCLPDANGFTDAFTEIIEQKTKYSARSKAALTQARKHDINSRAKELEKVYQKLL